MKKISFFSSFFLHKTFTGFAKQAIVLASIFIFTITTNAQNNDAAYINTITQRAQKIVATLGISDSTKFYTVQGIIVQQYQNLNHHHNTFNQQVISIQSDSTINKQTASASISSIEEKRTQFFAELHKKYIAQLQAELNAEQITKVKDGMTYNKVAVTYNGYCAMILNLTQEQKTTIYNYLVEAREFAMDAESSKKKDEWFGKYKGRINNYLSSQGYDLKKEGEEWQQRIKEAKSK
jgi:hypothetical protein